MRDILVINIDPFMAILHLDSNAFLLKLNLNSIKLEITYSKICNHKKMRVDFMKIYLNPFYG